jgi:hypothetical protein
MGMDSAHRSARATRSTRGRYVTRAPPPRAAFLALGLAAVVTPRNAHALGSVDIEIGLKLGGATNPSAANP